MHPSFQRICWSSWLLASCLTESMPSKKWSSWSRPFFQEPSDPTRIKYKTHAAMHFFTAHFSIVSWQDVFGPPSKKTINKRVVFLFLLSSLRPLHLHRFHLPPGGLQGHVGVRRLEPRLRLRRAQRHVRPLQRLQPDPLRAPVVARVKSGDRWIGSRSA